MKATLQTLPPFLCFGFGAAGSSPEWETTLGASTFVSESATVPALRNSLERAKAAQLQKKLRETLQHLASGAESLGEANEVADHQLKKEVSDLTDVITGVRRQIDEGDRRIKELKNASESNSANGSSSGEHAYDIHAIVASAGIAGGSASFFRQPDGAFLQYGNA